VTVIWEPPSVRDMRRLDPPIAREIRESVQRYADTREGDVRALHGSLAGLLRLRVRGWRVHLYLDRDHVHVVAVEKRGDAYRS
jgi:mRNA-degrading endonuclease RelE of RelBE toxin-antitoxin system